MPRLIEAEIGNLAPKALVFELPAAMRETPVVFRLDDGSLIMDAVPLIADQQLMYYGYELPLDELFSVDYNDANPEFAWDAQVFGLLTTECATYMLDQFEGLAITDGHTFVETGHREDVAVGAFLRDAVLDANKVKTRALLYAAAAIVKAETNQSELSIGGIAFMEANPNRGAAGEPDFFIRRFNLNHVALVENGRAGPEARLLNHKASLSHNPTKDSDPMKTIIVNGVAHEVPDAVADEFARMTTASSDLATTNTSLSNQVAALTTERDTAQGRADGLQGELETAQAAITNNQPDVPALAAAMANEHASFVTEAALLGHTDDLTLGGYDRAEVMSTVLNTRGATIPADASADYLKARWDAAVEAAGSGTTSAIDNAKPVFDGLASAGDSAHKATQASYFGGGKKKEA